MRYRSWRRGEKLGEKNCFTNVKSRTKIERGHPSNKLAPPSRIFRRNKSRSIGRRYSRKIFLLRAENDSAFLRRNLPKSQLANIPRLNTQIYLQNERRGKRKLPFLYSFFFASTCCAHPFGTRLCEKNAVRVGKCLKCRT